MTISWRWRRKASSGAGGSHIACPTRRMWAWKQEATAISGSVVPGLLQTAEYAHAIHEAAIPEVSTPELTPDVIDQRVEVRIRRQALLTKEMPLEFSAVLDEAVLHRLVGGESVMRAQLEASHRYDVPADTSEFG